VVDHQDGALDWAKGQVPDPLFKEVDLHAVSQGSDSVLHESRIMIMLLIMGGQFLLSPV